MTTISVIVGSSRQGRFLNGRAFQADPVIRSGFNE